MIDQQLEKMSDHESEEDPMNQGVIEEVEDLSDGKLEQQDDDFNMLENMGIKSQESRSIGEKSAEEEGPIEDELEL